MRCSKYLHSSYFFTCWLLPSRLLQWTTLPTSHILVSPFGLSGIHQCQYIGPTFTLRPLHQGSLCSFLAGLLSQRRLLALCGKSLLCPMSCNSMTSSTRSPLVVDTKSILAGNMKSHGRQPHHCHRAQQGSEVSSLPAHPINTPSSLPSSSSPLSSTTRHPSTLSQGRAPRSTYVRVTLFEKEIVEGGTISQAGRLQRSSNNAPVGQSLPWAHTQQVTP